MKKICILAALSCAFISLDSFSAQVMGYNRDNYIHIGDNRYVYEGNVSYFIRLGNAVTLTFGAPLTNSEVTVNVANTRNNNQRATLINRALETKASNLYNAQQTAIGNIVAAHQASLQNITQHLSQNPGSQATIGQAITNLYRSISGRIRADFYLKDQRLRQNITDNMSDDQVHQQVINNALTHFWPGIRAAFDESNIALSDQDDTALRQFLSELGETVITEHIVRF